MQVDTFLAPSVVIKQHADRFVFRVGSDYLTATRQPTGDVVVSVGTDDISEEPEQSILLMPQAVRALAAWLAR